MEQFLNLSSALTGYNPTELQATGMCETYYASMTSILGGTSVGQLLLTWEGLEEHAGGDAEAVEALLKDKIMADPMLGPMAVNLVSLWYLGQWNQMPADWRGLYGANARDQGHVVSSEAYREGLVWPTIGAHPMGAKMQGFGAWQYPPPGEYADE